ncbi:MAG TPA: hypothetical protein VLB81_00810, partial [Gaiellales bacterium]|nr:hypothetical protein [Gaiellales bacterium]
FALRDGRLVASGPPRDVMTSELIREVFDLDALVVPDPVSGAPIVLPRGRHHVGGAGAASAAASSALPRTATAQTGTADVLR